MGQKVNPYGFRLGITTDWKSKWIADKKEYAAYLHEDDRVRKYIRQRVRHAGVSAASTSPAPVTTSRSASRRSVPASSSVAVVPRRTRSGPISRS